MLLDWMAEGYVWFWPRYRDGIWAGILYVVSAVWSLSPGVTLSFDSRSFPSINLRCRLGRSVFLKGIGFDLRGLLGCIGIDGTGS